MTTYGAYDMNLPCKNPSCKSHGKPHPNCRCYGEGLAAGGAVSNFCDSAKPHNPNCEYYAGGGKIDPSQVQIEQPEIDPAKVEITSSPEESSIEPNEVIPEKPLDKYTSTGQKIGATLEGAAQGFAGPVATWAEQGLSKLGVPGLTDEDIRGRAEANPVLHGAGEAAGLAGGLYSGVGEAGLLAKGAARLLPESIPLLGKIGAQALKGFMTNAAIGGSNEVTKAMLGQGDPDHAVASALANVGLNGLVGGVLEGGAGALGATEAKIGSKFASALAGLGAKASGAPIEGLSTELNLLSKGLHDERAFKLGYDSYENLVKKAIGVAGDAAGYKLGGLEGSIIADKVIKPMLQKHLTRPVTAAGNLVVPAVTKWMSEGAPSRLLPILNYATQVEKGNKLLNSSVEALFSKEGGLQLGRMMDTERARDKLDKWIENGGSAQDIQQEIYNQAEGSTQGFAEGGDVEKGTARGSEKTTQPSLIQASHPLSMVYPEQNIMIQAAKGRMSNYLSSIRPGKYSAKLAFDAEPDDREQKRSYHKALDIANNPLSILHEIKKGTIDPEHVKHFQTLYPELNDVLQKKLTKRISEAQLNEEKPNYKTRQGLSLLMGTPLSGELAPQNIQAAQATFAMQQPQQGGAPTKNKKNTSSLTKVDDSYLTGPQARESRQQRQKS